MPKRQLTVYAVKNTKSHIRTFLTFVMDLKVTIPQFLTCNSNIGTHVVGTTVVCNMYSDDNEDVHTCRRIIELTFYT